MMGVGAVAKKNDTVMRCARYTDVNTSFRKETRIRLRVHEGDINGDDDDPVDDDESSIDK